MRAVTLILALTFALPAMARADCVVLLHGLARSPSSRLVMEEALVQAGYDVVNRGYPSTEADIAFLDTNRRSVFVDWLLRCVPFRLPSHSRNYRHNCLRVVGAYLARPPPPPSPQRAANGLQKIALEAANNVFNVRGATYSISGLPFD